MTANTSAVAPATFLERIVAHKRDEVAARRAVEIYPGMRVQPFHGNVVYDLGLGVFRWADVVLGGLDNREARLAINRACWKTNRPWISRHLRSQKLQLKRLHPLSSLSGGDKRRRNNHHHRLSKHARKVILAGSLFASGAATTAGSRTLHGRRNMA